MRTGLANHVQGELVQRRIEELEALMGSVDELSMDVILSLNDKRFNELLLQLTLVKKRSTLTVEIFNEVLRRISKRLTRVTFSDAERIKIKARGDRAGILIDGKPHYFADTKRDKGTYGATGRVEKIYTETPEGREYLALKEMIMPKNNEIISERDAKYNYGLFARKTMLFKCEEVIYLVMPWIRGKTLDKINERHMRDYDELVRIESFIALLVDIQTMHQNGRMHLDIKPANIIFDLENRKLQLIDFGSALRMLSKKQVLETPGLFDKRTQGSAKPVRMTQDIYSLLHVFKAVFPELGLNVGSPQSPRRALVNSQVYLTRANWGLMDKFVKTFIQEPLGDERLTISDVVDFMNIMKAEFLTMTHERADEIMQLFKSEVRLTTDAILCGRGVMLT